MTGPSPTVRWLVRSWPGRLELRRRYGRRGWRVLAPFARLHRATLARRVRVIAVCGSVGKTTTMRAVSAALGVPVGISALLNANSHAATAGSVLRLRPWQRHAVIEVAIGRPGQMRQYARVLRPNVVVMTAVASDHWRSFDSLESKRDEKAEMVRALTADGTAVLNADDENVRWMATQTSARTILFGFADFADVRASDFAIDWPTGSSFTVHWRGEARTVHTRLLGRQMTYPALAAIAVALLEGASLDAAVERLAGLQPTPGRMQITPLASGGHAVRDDFKSSIDTWRAALDAFAEVPARRRLAVIGEVSEDAGSRDYREIGQRAGVLVDEVVFVGGSKNFRTFRAAATAAGLSRDAIRQRRDAHEVVELLRDEVREGDALLIRGRWQQALGRVGLALAGRDVRCRADPCPFKRMLCDVCPFLEQPFAGPRD